MGTDPVQLPGLVVVVAVAVDEVLVDVDVVLEEVVVVDEGECTVAVLWSDRPSHI